MSDFQQPETTITFPKAIATSESLMTQIEAEKLTEKEIEGAISSLVSSKPGARGFFVAYLTSDRQSADTPSSGIINALKSSPEIVSELLVKNLAMSAAMAVTHRRDNNEEQAESSERVCRRTANLIQQINLDLINEELKQLQTSVTTNQGNYQQFLEKWGYDSEQKQAIAKAISLINF
jgi:hypothetical protein